MKEFTVTEPFDPRPTLFQAVDQVGTVLTAVTPADLELSSPCDDWTVRDLAGHVVAVLGRVGHIMHGGQPADLPTMLDVPDDKIGQAWDQARASLQTALADDAVLTRTVSHPAGPMPAAAALIAYVNELAVHAWDLNKALGDPVVLDAELAAGALAAAHQFLPADNRGGPIPFGDVVMVAADAPPTDQLAGWMGRDPAWVAV